MILFKKCFNMPINLALIERYVVGGFEPPWGHASSGDLFWVISTARTSSLVVFGAKGLKGCGVLAHIQ
jgi:hypothetical protein